MTRPPVPFRSAGAPGRGAPRHGRGPRGSVLGPSIPPVMTRRLVFESVVASMADYLRQTWPELRDVRFEVAGMPPSPARVGELPRWRIDPRKRRVTLYRVPIERATHPRVRDEVDLKLVIEAHVLRAVAELIGKDPWDLAPHRYRP